MNKHTKPKAAALLAMTIALTAVLAGCGGDRAGESGANNAPAAENTAVEPAASNAAEPDEGEAEPDAGEEPIQAEGLFVGLADPHTVAIEIGGVEKAFQVGDELADTIASLEADDPVKLSYTEKVVDEAAGTKQLQLASIEKDAASGAAGGSSAMEPAESGEAAALPAEKAFTVSLEGSSEEREAKLAEADGYALYVFEQFTFDAAANTLAMTFDKNYNVKIEKLPEGAKLEDVRAEAEKELGALGEVRELKGEEIAEPLRDARLFLLASDAKLQRELIVREVGGRLYRFSVNMPIGEAAEGFGPLAFVSLQSLVDRT